MAYYGQGDYYRMGDPGLFSSIGSFVKKAANVATGFLAGGPIGGVGALIAPQQRPPQIQIPRSGGRVTTVTPSAVLPGGVPFVQTRRRRRRMNYANGKALTRAIRRQDGFVKLARKALKGSGYKIVSKGSGSRKRVSIRESGPGSVHVG